MSQKCRYLAYPLVELCLIEREIRHEHIERIDRRQAQYQNTKGGSNGNDGHSSTMRHPPPF